MKKRVVILGAGGFIGRTVSSLFLQKKANVKLYSKHKSVVNGHLIEQLDISKNVALQCKLNKEDGIGTIVYLSCKIPKDLNNIPLSILFYNIKLHKQVIESWQRLKCHLIYASGSSVYGHSALLPWNESSIPMPDNYYSFSKLLGELLFQQIAKEENLPLTILRLSAPYGYKTSHKTVINIFIERALRREDLILWGSGKRKQDFTYIDDVARAFWLSYKNRKYGTFNIATGRSVTMKRLAHLIVKLTGSKSKIIFAGRSDPEDNCKVAIDISRAKSKLCFSPLYPLERGLERCIEEYRRRS